MVMQSRLKLIRINKKMVDKLADLVVLEEAYTKIVEEVGLEALEHLTNNDPDLKYLLNKKKIFLQTILK